MRLRRCADGPWQEDALAVSQQLVERLMFEEWAPEDEIAGLMLQPEKLGLGGSRRSATGAGRIQLGLAAATFRDVAAGGLVTSGPMASKPGPRPKPHLAGDVLAADLPKTLGHSVEELRAAIRARRHRTPLQRRQLSDLRAYIACEEPNAEAIAAILDCTPRIIRIYKNQGVALITELLESNAELQRKADLANDRLQLILDALKLNPVAEAAAALEDAEAA